MVRFVLNPALVLASVFLLCATSMASAQEGAWASERRLAASMNSQNADRARSSVRALMGSEERPDVRSTLACMEVFLVEFIVARDLQDPSPGAAERLSRLAVNVQELDASYARCQEGAPAGVHIDSARRRRVATQGPALAHAHEQVIASSGSPNRLGEVFEQELARITAALAPGLPDAWERARSLYETMPPPRPRPPQPPPSRTRSLVPAVGTGVLVLGFGFVSFMSSLAGLASGDGLHRLPAGGWGLTLGLLAALPAAYAWEAPSTALFATGGVLTGLSAAAGAALQLSGSTNRRFFGRGLLIGSGLNLLWTVGGVLLYGRRRALRRLAVGPWMPDGGGGLAAMGRF